MATVPNDIMDFVTRMQDQLNEMCKLLSSEESSALKVILDAIQALIQIKDKITSTINITELFANFILSANLYTTLIGIFRNASEFFERNIHEDHMKETIQLAVKFMDERKQIVKKLMDELSKAIIEPLYCLKSQINHNCCTDEELRKYAISIGRFDYYIRMLNMEFISCQTTLSNIIEKIAQFLGSTKKKLIGGLIGATGGAGAFAVSVLLLSNPIGMVAVGVAGIGTAAGGIIYSIFQGGKLDANKPTLDQCKRDALELQKYFDECQSKLRKYIADLQEYGVRVANYPRI